jgi:hypothetical protein
LKEDKSLPRQIIQANGLGGNLMGFEMLNRLV